MHDHEGIYLDVIKYILDVQAKNESELTATKKELLSAQKELAKLKATLRNNRQLLGDARLAYSNVRRQTRRLALEMLENSQDVTGEESD